MITQALAGLELVSLGLPLIAHRYSPRSVLSPLLVPITSGDADEEMVLLLGQGPAALAVELFEDLVHPPFLGGLADHPPLAAEFGAAPPPAAQRALLVGPDLGRAVLEAGVALGEVV